MQHPGYCTIKHPQRTREEAKGIFRNVQVERSVSGRTTKTEKNIPETLLRKPTEGSRSFYGHIHVPRTDWRSKTCNQKDAFPKCCKHNGVNVAWPNEAYTQLKLAEHRYYQVNTLCTLSSFIFVLGSFANLSRNQSMLQFWGMQKVSVGQTPSEPLKMKETVASPELREAIVGSAFQRCCSQKIFYWTYNENKNTAS